MWDTDNPESVMRDLILRRRMGRRRSDVYHLRDKTWMEEMMKRRGEEEEEEERQGQEGRRKMKQRKRQRMDVLP